MRPSEHPVEILNTVARVVGNQNEASWSRGRLLGIGVLLFVVGAKLGLIHFYGTDQPFADQWAAEGAYFLQAPFHGGLDWASFLWPHGEHRPAITRLITRGLIVANEGQWDCYVEVVFNLSIYAAFLMVAWRIACQMMCVPALVRRVADKCSLVRCKCGGREEAKIMIEIDSLIGFHP